MITHSAKKTRQQKERRGEGDLSDCNWTQTQNHLICKQTLNHFTLKCIRDMIRTYSQGEGELDKI